ncbi:Protein of unknown function [Actinomadura mexicana]|uniref:DinB superfamily protein n=1 Tax=Actinomadura mexicana TaxID=134959 RepID=A0A239E9J9_9ACTN|nr:Protein of unknown function [Actinomadura mexicana]
MPPGTNLLGLLNHLTFVERANEVLEGCAGLGAPVPRPRPGRPAPSIRWALAHMIEETGR